VVGLESDNGRLSRVRLRDGQTLDRDALFFFVDCDQATTVDRVYAAGNSEDSRALVPVAAGSGVAAAVAVNARLSFEDADRAVTASRVPRAKRQAR
jgi:thioredoxin reductase